MQIVAMIYHLIMKKLICKFYNNLLIILMNYSKRRLRSLTPERKRKNINTCTLYLEKFIFLFIFIFLVLWLSGLF
jgi:hypothetical protein